MSLALDNLHVDGIITGNSFSVRKAVLVVSTTNANIATAYANGQIVDGITLATNDRILLIAQATPIENGIYLVQTIGTPLRAPDLPDGSSASGIQTTVLSGTVNFGSIYICTSKPGSDITGTNNLTFAKTNASSGGVIPVTQGGTGLTSLTNNTFLTASSTTTMASTKVVPSGVVVGTTDSQLLTNKTLTYPTINSTATNHMLFSSGTNLNLDVLNQTTATSTLQVPNLAGTTDTIVLTSLPQTLSNKTLTTLSVTNDANIYGNLIVYGTTTTVDSTRLNVASNFITLNSNYTTNAPLDAGVNFVYFPTTTQTTLTGNFIAGVLGVSNPTVSTTTNPFINGDIILISGPANVNDGLYEVLSNAAGVLTIKGIGLTSAVYNFVENQFNNLAVPVSCIATKVNVSVLKTNLLTGVLQQGFGSNTSSIIFYDILSSNTVTLQIAYNNSSDPEITLNTSGITIKDNAVPVVGNLFEVKNNANTTLMSSSTTASVYGTNLAVGYNAITPPTNGAIIQGNTSVGSSSATSLFNVGSSNQFQINNTGVVTSGSWQGTIITPTYGGTGSNLSATGGTSQVLRQSTVGGNITVSQLAANDLSNGTTGSGAIVLTTSPTLVTPLLGTPTSGVLTNCTGYTTANLSGTISLTSQVSGTLPATNGGTGQNLYTVGDLLYASSTTALSKLAAGTINYVLTSGGPGASPLWTAISTLGVSSISGTANQITASASTGAVTISLPSAIITPGTLAVNGSLVANTSLTSTSTDMYNIWMTGVQTAVNGSGNQGGLIANQTLQPTNGATNSFAIYNNPTLITPSTKTTTNTGGIIISNTYGSNVGTITNAYGIYATSGTGSAGTITNSYGGYFQTQTAGANKVALYADSFLLGYATTATAAGTTTLTNASLSQQFFTGSTTQTVVLPVVSTLFLGYQFFISNRSSGVVTVQSSGANIITAMPTNTSCVFTCILTSGTTAASWDVSYDSTTTAPVTTITGTTNQINTSAATGAVTLSLSSTIVTPGTLAVNGAITATTAFAVRGSGSATNASSIAYFGQTSTIAGNLYGIQIDKGGVDSLLIGVNKNTATNSIPLNSTFISTFATSTAGLSIGRGDGAGLPSTTDIFINSTGQVGIGTTSQTQRLEIGGTSSQLYLNSATSNMIQFNTSGFAPPTFTTARSIGTKIILYPQFANGSSADYAIGIDASVMWFGLPVATGNQFRWYGGITEWMRLNNTGLTIGSTTTTGMFNVGTAAQFQVSSTGAITTSSTAAIGGSLQSGSALTVNSTSQYNTHLQGTMTAVDAGPNQWGLNINTIMQPTSGSINSFGQQISPSLIAPSTMTITNAGGLYVFNTSSSNVGTITNLYGIRVAAGSAGVGTITNSYGGYFTTQTAGTSRVALYTDSLLLGYATTATAAGTTTLTNASLTQQFFTGSTTQTVVLPVVSTLFLGYQFRINNRSSGVVTVQSSGSNTITAMPTNTSIVVTCILTSGTTAASWDVLYDGTTTTGVTSLAGTTNQINTSASTGAVTLSLSSTLVAPGTLAVTTTSQLNGNTGIGAAPGSSVLLVGGTATVSATNTITAQTGTQLNTTVSPSGSGTISAAAELYVNPSFVKGSIATWTLAAGIYVGTYSLTSVSNYGLYVDAPTSGISGNYGAYFGGSVGVGTAFPSSRLDVQGTVARATDTLESQSGVYFNPTVAPTGSGTISTGAALTITPSFTKGSIATWSNTAGIFVNSFALAATNNYGLYLFAPTGGTNNYAAYFGGRIGISNTAPSAMLQTAGIIASSTNTIPAQSGIYFNTAVNPTGAVTDATALYVAPSFSNAGGSIVSAYGLRVATYSVFANNNYGLYVDLPTTGINNYAAYFGGSVGVNASSTASMLVVGVNNNFAYGLNIQGATNNINSSQQISLYLTGTHQPLSAVNIYSISANESFIAATGTTIDRAAAMYISNTSSSNVGTITGLYGLYVDTGSAGAGTAITAAYGGYFKVPTAGTSDVALYTDSLLLGYATTTTSAGTTTLTNTSVSQQFFTGSTTHSVVLPVVSTLFLGSQFFISNRSSGVVTVLSSGLNTITAIPSNTSIVVTCILTSGTTAASWDFSYNGTASAPVTSITGTTNQINASASTGAVTLSLSSTIVTPGTVAVNGALTAGTAFTVTGAGSASNLVNLATFTSGTSPTAGNLYSIYLDKHNVDAIAFGINKNTITGSVPANGTFITTYSSTGTLTLGRGGSNGLPSNADIHINSTGQVGIGTSNPSQRVEIGGSNAQIFLNSGTSNMLMFNLNGVAPPTFTTARSVGAKIVLYPTFASGSQADYAIGIENATLWFGVPHTGTQFRWYGGITEWMRLNNTGLTIGSTTTTSMFNVGTAAQFQVNSSGSVVAGAWNGSVIPMAYGGTNANLTAAVGSIVYSSSTAMALLAPPATNNCILLGQTAANPIWSTATYPSTAGTTSTILRSDGTNWVNSSNMTVDSAGYVTSTGLTINTTSSTVPCISLVGNVSSLFPALFIYNPATTAGSGSAIKVCNSNNPGGFTFDGISWTRGTLGGYSQRCVVSAFNSVLTIGGDNSDNCIGLNDANPRCGMSCPTNGQIGFASSTTAPANSLVVSGNLGIGTSNPSQRVEIGGSNAQIFLNSGTSNMLMFNLNGVAPPTFTTARSVGAKIVLSPNFVNGSSADYAIGIENATMWFGVPTAGAQFRWFGGITAYMRLNSTGLTIGSPTTTSMFNVGTAAQFQVNSSGSVVAGTWNGTNIALNRGGTAVDNSAAVNGGVAYKSASGIEITANALSGRILQANGTAAPTWSSAAYPSSAGTAGTLLRSDGTSYLNTTTTFADTYPASNILYSNGANTITGLATANNGVLITNGTGVPSISSTLPTGLALQTPASGVLTNCTGYPTSSLSGTISLTSQVAGVLPATNGGTGQSIYTVGDILFANTTTTLSKLPVGSAGNVLTVSGGLPSWQPAASGGVATVTGTTNQITSSGTTAITLSLPSTIITPGTLAVTTTSQLNGNTGIGIAPSSSVLYVGGTATVSATNTLAAQSGVIYSPTVAPSGAGTITDAASHYILPVFTKGSIATWTRASGTYIASFSLTAISNYGLYVNLPTGGTSGNYAAYFGGAVGIADATPGSSLSVLGNAQIGFASGTVAPGNGLLVSGNTSIGIPAPTSTVGGFNVGSVFYNTGTASQSTNTVTGTGTTFTSSMIGYLLVFANNVSAGYIVSVASGTSITVTTSQTVVNQAYAIYDYGIVSINNPGAANNGNTGVCTIAPPNMFSVCPVNTTLTFPGTVSQSLTTVTGVGTNFTSAMLNMLFTYTTGVNGGIITAVASTTSLTVSTSQTVTSTNYLISYAGFRVDGTGQSIAAGFAKTSETISAAGALSPYLDSIIDAANAPFTVTLGAGITDQIKRIKIKDRAGGRVTIDCTGGGGGTFIMQINSGDYVRDLRYNGTEGYWKIEMGVSNFTPLPDSFFPTIQQGLKLKGNDGIGTTLTGTSIAIAADGNTLAIGGPGDNTNIGAVWVFTRSLAGTWTQQGSKITGTGGTGAALQGTSVALSANGDTLAFGGPGDNTNIGAVWVFTRTGTTWTQQGTKLTGTGGTAAPTQGAAVALSANGNTLAVGGNGDNTSQGAVWVFTRTAGVWTQQAAKITGNAAVTGSAQVGSAVALSADGNTLSIGAPLDNLGVGAHFIFTRVTNTWTIQGAKLTGTGGTGAARIGTSVALSADGNTLAVGGNLDNTNVGAFWVFTRTTITWTQQGLKMTGTGGTGSAQIGRSIALSADGNTLAVGGSGDASGVGAIWIFTRTAGAPLGVSQVTTWFMQGSKITGTDGTATPNIGRSVALSSNGNAVAVGASADDTNIGAFWVFI